MQCIPAPIRMGMIPLVDADRFADQRILCHLSHDVYLLIDHIIARHGDAPYRFVTIIPYFPSYFKPGPETGEAAKNEILNSTPLRNSRVYFCTVDIYSFIYSWYGYLSF